MMRTPNSPLWALVLALSTLSTVTAPAFAAEPRAVLGQSVIDVGTVSRGDKVEQTFRIRNEGEATLEVTDVKPACGCTVVDFDSRIGPGGTGELVATLDTKGMRGPVAKTVQVFTNDPRNPRLELVLKADVRSYVEAAPGYARFLAVRGKGAETMTQTLWSEVPGEFAIRRARSPYGFIDVDVREASEEERVAGKEGRQWIVEIALDPMAPDGQFADFVTLDIDHPRLRQMRIPVSGFVRPVVTVLPRVADFGRKDPATNYSQVLELHNLGDAAVTLGDATSSVPGVIPSLETVEAGKLYRLKLTLDPSMPKGSFEGTVSIPTNSRLQPMVEIDVRGSAI